MDWLPKVRGKESTTLLFVALSWSAVFAKFVVAGADLGTLGIPPQMSATEFATSVALILGIWLGREIFDKKGKENA